MYRPDRRPGPQEAADWYQRYIARVPDIDIVSVLHRLGNSTPPFLGTIDDEQWIFRYETNKWSLKESIIHVIDTERIMAYRALRIARGDQTPLIGFSQDNYVPASNAALRTPTSIITEYRAVREATLELFRHFDEAAWNRTGFASGSPVSVLALAYIIAGHELHHLELTRTLYLKLEA